MAAAIKGKQVSWGIPSAGVTGILAAVTAGIIDSFEITAGGGTTTVSDEDDDIVTRIDHAAENKFTFTVDCTSATVKPAKGAELVTTAFGTLDGIVFTAGRSFVDDAKVVYQRAGVKKLSISATHYPIMAADA